VAVSALPVALAAAVPAVLLYSFGELLPPPPQAVKKPRQIDKQRILSGCKLSLIKLLKVIIYLCLRQISRKYS
jgi:hypothetical protein